MFEYPILLCLAQTKEFHLPSDFAELDIKRCREKVLWKAANVARLPIDELCLTNSLDLKRN